MHYPFFTDACALSFSLWLFFTQTRACPFRFLSFLCPLVSRSSPSPFSSSSSSSTLLIVVLVLCLLPFSFGQSFCSSYTNCRDCVWDTWCGWCESGGYCQRYTYSCTTGYMDLYSSECPSSITSTGVIGKRHTHTHTYTYACIQKRERKK